MTIEARGAFADVRVSPGRITVEGEASNSSVAPHYLDSRLGDNGAAAINTLMEDAATAAIALSRLRQVHVGGAWLDGGTRHPAIAIGARREPGLREVRDAG